MMITQPVVLGVDVGGTKILTGYVGRDATVYSSKRYPMDRTNQETTLNSIYRAIADFTGASGDRPTPLAMGLGLVGHTLPDQGIWHHAMNLSVDRPVAISDYLSNLYRMPVRIDNDVRSATLAELRYGAGKEVENFIYLNVGTGLACGIVTHGQVVRGANNYAGELGHMVVDPEGEVCDQCGRRGCLEPIASGGGMLDQVRARLPDHPQSPLNQIADSGKLDVAAIIQAAENGDELAYAVTERAFRAIGIAVVNLIDLLNPELIVLGGGVFTGGWGIDRLRKYVALRALPAASESLRGIVRSPLRVDQVGLLGATCLAWDAVD
jgi:glucokinase